MKPFFTPEESHNTYFKKYGEKVVYKKGQHIVWPVDAFPWVYNIESGLARVTFKSKDEETRIIGFFTPGITFAQYGSFFDLDSGTIEFIAEVPTIAYRVRREAFFAELESNKEFSRAYLNICLRNQMFLVDRIVYQGENGIHRKLLRWILFMVKYYGAQVPKTKHIEIGMQLTQSTIAEFLHVTRESANAAIRALTKKKYIAVADRKIVVLDYEAIRNSLLTPSSTTRVTPPASREYRKSD